MLRGDTVPWASLLTLIGLSFLPGLRILRWRNNIKSIWDGGGGGTPWEGRGITTGHTGQGNIDQGLPRFNFTKPKSSTNLFLGFGLSYFHRGYSSNWLHHSAAIQSICPCDLLS